MSERRQISLWRFILAVTLLGAGFGLLRFVLLLGSSAPALGLVALCAAGASFFSAALCLID